MAAAERDVGEIVGRQRVVTTAKAKGAGSVLKLVQARERILEVRDSGDRSQIAAAVAHRGAIRSLAIEDAVGKIRSQCGDESPGAGGTQVLILIVDRAENQSQTCRITTGRGVGRSDRAGVGRQSVGV